MKRLSLLKPALMTAALALAAGAFAAPPAPAPPPPAPANPSAPSGRIAFDSVNVNAGDVVRGQDVVATFTYHNNGVAPLHILAAKPG
jgi:hypothetical protein